MVAGAVSLLAALVLSAGCGGPGGEDGGAGVVPIGVVQGRRDVSPYAGRVVTVRGIVHLAVTVPRAGGREPLHGIFLQNRAGGADGDPETSDGIYVHLGSRNRLPSASGARVPAVGDAIVVRGTVQEYRGMTQITRPELVRLERPGLDPAEELPETTLEPPADLEAALRYFERLEGMRVRVPEGAVVQGGREGYDVLCVIREDGPFGRRKGKYLRRVFRDVHPLDNDPERAFDDGNGERIFLGDLGLRRAGSGPGPLLPPGRTFDVLAEGVSGAMNYTHGQYRVEVDRAPELRRGPDPSGNHPPGAPDPGREFTIATFNVENLYDLRDDPDDPCDAPDDPGAGGIRKPFNYLPASDEEYRTRLGELALQIARDLHAPDIVLVQEAEDQDLGRGGKGGAGAGDGMPDTLQDLASAIEAAGGPRYRAVCDRDGADVRGIVCAYLYRTDRVALPAPGAGDPVLSAAPRVRFEGKPHPMNREAGNPRSLNAELPEGIRADDEGWGRYVFSRAPQVALFEVRPAGAGAKGGPVRLYVVNNHLSSRPQQRVGPRRAQAAYAAAIARAVLDRDPGALVVVGGDLNVFPRPDDPFPPGHRMHPSDQLGALYEAGLTNLYDRMLAQAPEAAYTYVFEGQAQTIDQLFVSPGLLGRLVEVRAAHVNADWPAAYPGDGPRGASDHDPVVARFLFEAAR